MVLAKLTSAYLTIKSVRKPNSKKHSIEELIKPNILKTQFKEYHEDHIALTRST